MEQRGSDQDWIEPVTRERDYPDLWGFLGFHPSLREVLEELGWSGDVWLTEFGWRTTDLGEQQVADNYMGLFNDWLTGDPDHNWIDKLLFYHAETDEYGIFNPDGSPRAAYSAIRDFIAATRVVPVEVIPVHDTARVQFSSTPGVRYGLECSADMTVWIPIGITITGTGNSMYGFIPTGADTRKVYRLVSGP